jgi:uncharacterized iron-regulated membrane protein
VPPVTWATAAILSVLFPLAGATILAIAILDWTLARRLRRCASCWIEMTERARSAPVDA